MQYAITGTVTKQIVDRFELIEIEAEHRQRMHLRRLRPQFALQELAHPHPVGQSGEIVVPGEVLHARLGLHFESDIRGGAAVAGDPLRRDNRFNRNMAVALVAHRRKITAVQQAAMARLAGKGDPIRQRLVFGLHQLAERAANPGRYAVPGDPRKTLRKPGKTQLGVRLPDPVRGRLGNVTKTPFAGGERQTVLRQ